MCFLPCCVAICVTMCAFELGASYARKLERAKTNARRARAGLPPHFTKLERFKMWKTATFNFYIARWVCPWRVYGWRSHKVPWLFRQGTVGNQMFISTKYFVYGCLVSTLCFFLLAFHLDYPTPTAFVITVFLGFIISIGMAFNVAFRCVIHLCIPQIFSTKGRSLMLSYVFIMVMTHPLANFKHNLEVMSGTITCGQQLAVNSTKALAKAAAGPVIDMLKDIRGVLASIKQYVDKLKAAFLAVKRMFQQVADALVAAKEWLRNNANVCGNDMGTPFHRCQQTFVDVKWTCVRNLRGVGLEFISGVCNVAEWGKVVCYLLKGLDKMCEITDAAEKLVKDKVSKPVKSAIERVKNTFYFSVDIDYHYNVTLKQSQTAAQILAKVRKEVKKRLQPLSVFKHWTNFWMTLMLMLVIFKAHRYRKLYLTRDGFDNFYLVEDIQDIDNARRALNKERVYPMPKREYLRYAIPGSPLLTLHELIKLGKGIIFFYGTGFQVYLFISLDFLLYCILYLIQKFGSIDMDQTVPSHSMMHVQGSGILADIYRALISQFDPMKKPTTFSLDTSKCLPHPTEPNWKIFKTIGIVMLFCLLSIFCQPYFARLRHEIAHKYYPKRQRQRALWLYNNILMRRGSVMFFVRRDVRKLFQGKTEDDDANDVLAVCAAKCGLIGKCLKLAGVKYKYCAACGTSGKQDDMERFRHCQQYECNTCYCLRCYVELGNVCTACMAACDYGDLELSDEKDSSDEDEPKPTVSRMILERLEEERGSLSSSPTASRDLTDAAGQIQSYSDSHSSYIAWSSVGSLSSGSLGSVGSMGSLRRRGGGGGGGVGGGVGGEGGASATTVGAGGASNGKPSGKKPGSSGSSSSSKSSFSTLDSLLGDPTKRVVVPDPSGGRLMSIARRLSSRVLGSQGSILTRRSSVAKPKDGKTKNANADDTYESTYNDNETSDSSNTNNNNYIGHYNTKNDASDTMDRSNTNNSNNLRRYNQQSTSNMNYNQNARNHNSNPLHSRRSQNLNLLRDYQTTRSRFFADPDSSFESLNMEQHGIPQRNNNRNLERNSGVLWPGDNRVPLESLNTDQHRANQRHYNRDLERNSELLWSGEERVPTRPVVELASMEIFTIIDDLKEKFVWKTDWLDHGIGMDGVAWWEDEEGEEEAGPTDQLIERQ